jgi:flagellar biosynthesis protein FlhF
MELKTYRAKSLHEALRIVRHELGPDAAVLHTREVRRGWLGGHRQFEITASADVNVPSRFPPSPATEERTEPDPAQRIPPADLDDYRSQFRDDLKEQIADLQSMVEDLSRQSSEKRQAQLPEVLVDAFADLVDVAVPEDVARQLIERVRGSAAAHELEDPLLIRARLSRLIEKEMNCSGPILVRPGQPRVVAIVGPTGVGKTTTIAKLAANFHLHEQCRVGLITVDTYRIAAVDQLRAYADIIDLPMDVVSTPAEMRAAVSRLADLDLVLVDTAGRSHRDEVRIQELKSLLAEAQADEVHLALSSVASLPSMQNALEQFEDTGVQSVILTKMDEASGVAGGLLPFMHQCRLPISYVAHGQSVPEDITPASRRQLARAVMGHRDPFASPTTVALPIPLAFPTNRTSE